MATGVPYPRVTWFKDNVVLKSGPRVKITDTSANADIVELDLGISNVWYTDAGIYSCSAGNALGQDTSKVSLIVYGKNYYLQLKSISVRLETRPLVKNLTLNNRALGASL